MFDCLSDKQAHGAGEKRAFLEMARRIRRRTCGVRTHGRCLTECVCAARSPSAFWVPGRGSLNNNGKLILSALAQPPKDWLAVCEDWLSIYLDWMGVYEDWPAI